MNLLLAAAAIVAGSVVQRVSGVGGGFITVPLVAMIDVDFLPGPLVLATVALSVLMAWREWSFVDWRGVPLIMAGFIPGSAVGAWILSVVPPEQLGLVFGGTILLAVVISCVGLHPQLNRWTAGAAGFVSGAMGTSTAIGGPPLAILYQRRPGPELRATLAVLFTLCSLFIVLVLAAIGRFGSADFFVGLWLTPGFFVGYLLGGPLVRRLQGRSLSAVVLLVSAAAAIALIVKSI